MPRAIPQRFHATGELRDVLVVSAGADRDGALLSAPERRLEQSPFTGVQTSPRDLRSPLGRPLRRVGSIAGSKSPTWRTVERGPEIDLRCVPPLTREERYSLLLHEAVSVRRREKPEAVLIRARASPARIRELHPGARLLLDEWQCLRRRPLDALLPVLTDTMPRARELRHVTPFTGILSAAERAQVYRAFAQRERDDASPGTKSLDHAS